MTKYIQDDLPNFLDVEAQARETNIDKEAFERHKQAMIQRWFGYYKKCKDQQTRFKLIDQYNYLAQQRDR